MLYFLRDGKVEDAGVIAQMHIQSWQEIYHGVLPKRILKSLDLQHRQQFWRKKIEEGMQVSMAVAERHAVGFVACGACRRPDAHEAGEIYTIHVIPSCRHQGVGKMLFEQARLSLKEQRLVPFYLWTGTSSPASQFYRALGGELTEIKLGKIGGQPFEESLYIFH